MTGIDLKLTALTELTTVADDDLFYVVHDPSGTPLWRRISRANLLKGMNINLKTATELTIASGVITKTQSWHTIDTQADVASDDLDTINGGVDGDILYARANHTDRTVVVKHGTGNILCAGGADITLDSTGLFVLFIYDGTLSKWLAMQGGGGGGFLSNIVEDTTPQLGGNLDLQQFSIQLPDGEPTSDDTGVGIIESVTVDTNSTGVGCPLFWAADGHMDECDADAIATMPCSAIALETGTGTKKVLLFGKIRNDGWAWTAGQIIYVGTNVGTLTATAPTGEDDVIQPVGRAISDDCIMFNPNMVYITHKA